MSCNRQSRLCRSTLHNAKKTSHSYSSPFWLSHWRPSGHVPPGKDHGNSRPPPLPPPSYAANESMLQPRASLVSGTLSRASVAFGELAEVCVCWCRCRPPATAPACRLLACRLSGKVLENHPWLYGIGSPTVAQILGGYTTPLA